MNRSVTARRIAGVAAAAAALLATSAVGTLGIADASGAPATEQGTATAAYVRTAHLSPDTPKVDVYLTSFGGSSTRLWIAGVGYGDVSGYRRMPAGQYVVSMRPHGAPASSSAALSWSLTLRPRTSYTAAAIGRQAALKGIVVKDTLSDPKNGSGYLRVVQASSTAPNVEVTAGGTTITPKAAFGSVTRYVAVPAGKIALRARSLSDPTVAGSVQLRVSSRSINSVVVLDKRGGGLVTRPLLDAAGPKDAAVGSVETGGGATSGLTIGDDTPTGLVAGIGALALLLLAAATTVARRRA